LIGAFGNNLNIALFALLGMIIALLALNWIWLFNFMLIIF
jgi:hypothetical protein